MAKIKVKLREEKKGQFQPAVEKKLAKRSAEAMKSLEKKYNDKLNNQSKWKK